MGESQRAMDAMLQRGVKADVMDFFGNTAHHYNAFFAGDPEISRILAKYKADVNRTSVISKLPARAVCRISRIAALLGSEQELLLYFMESEGSIALHLACLFGHHDLVKVLLEA